MASSSSLGRDDHLVGTLNRRSPLRRSARDGRAASKRDAVLLGTTSFSGDSAYDVAGKSVNLKYGPSYIYPGLPYPVCG
jgi:hypothetical protein